MNIDKYFIKIIYIFFLLKTTLLFWSAHPFDFWAFVTTIQRNVLYGWDLFEYWNKGNLLMVLWYPMYSLYLKSIEFFSFQVDNLLLLHFFFKLPFLFLDLLCGFLIFRIILKLTGDRNKAKIGFLFWWLNPIVYYIYGIHGHYELLVPFSIILLITGLLDRNSLAIAIALVIGFTTKYFFIILIPFVVIYLISNKEHKLLKHTLQFFITGLLISYNHFFFNPDLIEQTFNSIISLSRTNAPIGVDFLKLPPLNTVSAINFLFYPDSPITNLNNEIIFDLANQGIKLTAILSGFHILARIYSIYIKQKKYEIGVLLRDLFLVTIYFLMFLTNFQSHYFCWLIPFFIIFIFLNPFILSLFMGYTVIGFIYSLRNELGARTFFLDILPQFYPVALNNRSDNIIYLEGFLIILLLILSAICLLFGKIFNEKRSQNNFLLNFGLLSILWILLLGPFVQAIPLYFAQDNHPNTLAFSGSIYHRGVIFGNYQVSKISNNIIFFNDNNMQGSLISSELQKLSDEQKKNFQTSILIKNVNDFENMKNILSKSKFNDCEIENYQNAIFNYFDKSYYSGFYINIDCVKKTNNNINSNNYSKFSINDIELYISNKKVDYLYMDKNIINIAALIGIVYLYVFIIGSFRLINKLKKDSENIIIR